MFQLIRGLFETKILGKGTNVNPWWKRPSEGLVHSWWLNEKLLQNRGEATTMYAEIGAVSVSETNCFRGAVKK